MALTKISSLILLLFSLNYTIMQTTSTPTYIYSACSNTTTFVNNSKYQTNLNTLFHSLSNATSNPTGFYITSAANGTSDAVYGLFLCRGDQNATACNDCVKTATTKDLPNTYCPNRKVAVIWYEECLLHYSNQSLLGIMQEFPGFSLVNTQNINGNQTQFTELLGDTMNDLAAEAVSNNRSGKKYATTVAKFNSLSTIYAMGQCTPDLSTDDCIQCLNIAIGKLTVKMGARVLQPSCYIRYEMYPFYNGSTSTPPSPGPHSPAGKGKGIATNLTIMNNCDNIVWPAILPSDGINVPSGFSLSKGESKIINIQPGWVGSVWGRTLCSFNSNNEQQNYFSCQTGDCGNGKVECQENVKAGPMTQARFQIGLSQKPDTYSVSVESGYNLPIMVAPQGGTRAMCRVADCTFKLDDNTCPQEFRVGSGETSQSIIACMNPCYYLSQAFCKNVSRGPNCQVNKYCDASSVFGDYCPMAHMDNSDPSNTTFRCERNNYHPSYNITFCPSSNMIKQFSKPFQPLLAPPPSGKSKASKMKLFVAIGVPTVVLVLLISSCTYHCHKKAKKYFSLDVKKEDQEFTTAESLMFELGTLQTATNYFADDQKLGGGGFGNVYKGTLPSGQEIAVKRLTRLSDHGLEAFKNEAILIAKLQHKNLVRILGFCSTGEERLLVYEFVPNKSLDYLLFEKRKQGELDWPTRYNIVLGISRGLLYLHEDSRPRIIHRDLKAPNILLEKDMNPKISDFGLARIFKIEQAEDATSVIAGTYGYMAPEYAMHGQFSVKSDAYSFGVLLLEIVSGKKINSRFPVFGDGDLLTYAWRCWKDERPLEFLDPTLRDSYSADEVLRCIHLGLLCVQENSHERPTMSTIVFMLNTDSNTNTLPKPQCPRSFYRSNTDSSQAASSNQHVTATTDTSSDDPTPYTRNSLTVSDMSPR